MTISSSPTAGTEGARAPGTARSTRVALAMLVALAGAAACGDDPTAPAAGARLALEATGLRALDPARDGTYEAWVIDAGGMAHSVGRFAALDGSALEFDLPIAAPRAVLVTLEPPDDSDPAPSDARLLGGSFRGSSATLSIEGFVTAFGPLDDAPGAHSLFTSSNNVSLGYPSLEHSGLWLFSLDPSINESGSRFVHLTILDPGWLYEGWIVRDHGTQEAVWIAYGKFRPDAYGFLNSRDATGSGPFSGDADYRNGGIEDVPGDEWTVNPFGLALPGGQELPLRLDEVDAASGEPRWSHVITVEPAFEEDEPLLTERPFVVQPYLNAIAAGPPGDPRVIGYVEEGVPHGRVRPADR